jgi:hypothetical protein
MERFFRLYQAIAGGAQPVLGDPRQFEELTHTEFVGLPTFDFTLETVADFVDGAISRIGLRRRTVALSS